MAAGRATGPRTMRSKAMTAQTIDYTVMRLGTRPDGQNRIVVCPKCGRKGLLNFRHGHRGSHPINFISHREVVENIGGIAVIHGKETCFVEYEQAFRMETLARQIGARCVVRPQRFIRH
jgi:hypothetical protein